MGEGKIELVEMEGRLRADESGDYRRSLAARLADARGGVKAALNSGLAPDEFSIANRLLLALISAEQAIETCWSRSHPDSSKSRYHP